MAFHTFPVPEFSSPAFSSLAFSASPLGPPLTALQYDLPALRMSCFHTIWGQWAESSMTLRVRQVVVPVGCQTMMFWLSSSECGIRVMSAIYNCLVLVQTITRDSVANGSKVIMQNLCVFSGPPCIYTVKISVISNQILCFGQSLSSFVSCCQISGSNTCQMTDGR